jgi:hypothetical protein
MMDQSLEQLVSPTPYRELAFGILVLIVIIFVHGIGIRVINQRFSASWVRVTPETPHWWLNLMLGITIAALTILHLGETLLWSLPIYAMGLIPNMRDCYFYVLENYTTLGEGSVSLPHDWRLVGPIIAISGLFTFGWTTGVLVSIMTDFGRLDKSRAKDRRSS